MNKSLYLINDFAMTQREKIIAELVRRLNAAFPSVLITRGFMQPAPNVFPSICIVEGEEKVENPSRMVYESDLQVKIYYFIAEQDLTQIYPKGNDGLTAIRMAVDTDVTFANLVINYGIIFTEIFQEFQGIIQIQTIYHFRYLEPKILQI